MPDDEQPKSPEDVFREAVGDVSPLTQDRPEPFKPRRRPVPLNLPTGEDEDDGLADVDGDTPEFLDFVRPGIQRRLYDELRRGLLPPEASLDLHGMRVSDARGALLRFLGQSTDQRRRCVRIVHGKGYGSQERQPVLKQKLNRWLQQRAEVLAFCSAPRWDGGTGAAYVLLSRKLVVR
ncbi:MAG: Smr/MutS family endonuclease [Gammaproteobacteria bacterium]|jgi:DNA-nicking Smr family endonuclease|nr:Smr/MutS family endonuclease [Gammaproteobacteria bacterium]